MKEQARAVRKATGEDVPFLARMGYEASLPPFEASFWDRLVEPTGTSTPVFLEAMFRLSASSWGNVEDFIILELDGQPVATCAVFRPEENLSSEGPFNLNRLPEIATALAWSNETAAAFRATYEDIWGIDTDFLKPQAETIIETVAVAPEYRSRGIGDTLIRAAFGRAREMGAASIGIMAINGNKPAQTLYEKHFEPYVTFHAAYFEHQIPGLTKYQASLFQERTL